MTTPMPGIPTLNALHEELSDAVAPEANRALLLAVSALRLGAPAAMLAEVLAPVPRAHEAVLWQAALESGAWVSTTQLLAWGASADLGLGLLLTRFPSSPAVAQGLLDTRSTAVVLPAGLRDQLELDSIPFMPTTWLGLGAVRISANDSGLLTQLADRADLLDRISEAEWALGLVLTHTRHQRAKLTPEAYHALEQLLGRISPEAYATPVPLVPRADLYEPKRVDRAWQPGVTAEDRFQRRGDHLLDAHPQLTAQIALLRLAQETVLEEQPIVAQATLLGLDWQRDPARTWHTLMAVEPWSWVQRRDKARRDGEWPRSQAMNDLLEAVIRAGLPVGDEVPVRLASVLAFGDYAAGAPFEASALGRLTRMKAQGVALPALTAPQLRGLLEGALHVALPRDDARASSWGPTLATWASPAFEPWVAPADRVLWQQAVTALLDQWQQITVHFPTLANDPMELFLDAAYADPLRALERHIQVSLGHLPSERVTPTPNRPRRRA